MKGTPKTKTPPKLDNEEPMRLQKFLSRAGVASRREAERMITGGRVKVNRRIVKELGTKVDPIKDRVTVDGQGVRLQRLVKVRILHKQRGLICTRRDPEGRKTVFDHLGEDAEGLSSVGRLDYNTEGVLLFTNDGDLAYRLERPEYKIARVYRVRVRGPVNEERLASLVTEGVIDDGEVLKADEVRMDGVTVSHVWITVTLREGKNRHVRRMCEALGLSVARLIRVRFANIDTKGLRPGKWRDLKPGEIRELANLVKD
ncbi:MAG: pseudouridine synthase [Pseudomonadota bacterium]